MKLLKPGFELVIRIMQSIASSLHLGSRSGRILRANLYDRALSAEEVRASAQSAHFSGVSDAQIDAALSAEQRALVAVEKQKIAAFDAQLEKLPPMPEPVDERALWTDVARALFTFKEFIYVK